jgi:hypothetical protein
MVQSDSGGETGKALFGRNSIVSSAGTAGLYPDIANLERLEKLFRAPNQLFGSEA